MHIVKRIFGAIFLLSGLFCLVAGFSLFGDGNKHDAFNFFGLGGAGLFFSLIFFATSGKKKAWTPMQPGGYPQQPGGYPQQPMQPGGYGQQQQPQGYPQRPQGYPQPQQGYPQQPQQPQQQQQGYAPPQGYPQPPPPGYPPRGQ